MKKRLSWTCVLSIIVTYLSPFSSIQAASIPPPTFIPPVEANFYGGTQQMITAPMGLAVNAYTLELNAFRTDLILPGCELPMEVSFTYTPGPDRRGNPPMGRGWNLMNSVGYTESGAGVVTLSPIQGQTVQLTPGNGGLTALHGGGYRYQASDGTIYFFDDPTHRQVTKMESPTGNYLLFSYDNNDNLEQMTDNYGRSFDFTYQNSHLASVTDANVELERMVRYVYDADGFLNMLQPVFGLNRRTEGCFRLTGLQMKLQSQ